MSTLRLLTMSVVTLSALALSSCCGCSDEEQSFTPVETKTFTPAKETIAPVKEITPAPIVVKKSKK